MSDNILRKIEELEKEIEEKEKKNPKSKANSFHSELLKAKLAKLRRGLKLPKSQRFPIKEESFTSSNG